MTNINCVDVAMPQRNVSVEAVDPVFQTKMLDMLKTGRPMVVDGIIPIQALAVGYPVRILTLSRRLKRSTACGGRWWILFSPSKGGD
jgi:hypothetical protein